MVTITVGASPRCFRASVPQNGGVLSGSGTAVPVVCNRRGRFCYTVRAGAEQCDVGCEGNGSVYGDFELGRRSLLAGLVVTTSLFGSDSHWASPALAGELQPQIYGNAKQQKAVYDATQKALRKALKEKGGTTVDLLGGSFLRAAFHDAGTWDAKTGTGGADGSLQFERDDPKNGGLKPGIDILVDVKEDLNRSGVPVTMADVFQIAGAEGMAIAGGPRIRVPIGRKDAVKRGSTDQLPPETLSADELKERFLRNGYNIKDLVALSGAHTIGKSRVHLELGFMDKTPKSFDNDYYKRLLEGGGNFRTDRELVKDPETLPYVQKYARNQASFRRDFVSAYIKMGLFGVNAQGTVGPRV